MRTIHSYSLVFAGTFWFIIHSILIRYSIDKQIAFLSSTELLSHTLALSLALHQHTHSINGGFLRSRLIHSHSVDSLEKLTLDGRLFLYLLKLLLFALCRFQQWFSLRFSMLICRLSRLWPITCVIISGNELGKELFFLVIFFDAWSKAEMCISWDGISTINSIENFSFLPFSHRNPLLQIAVQSNRKYVSLDSFSYSSVWRWLSLTLVRKIVMEICGEKEEMPCILPHPFSQKGLLLRFFLRVLKADFFLLPSHSMQSFPIQACELNGFAFRGLTFHRAYAVHANWMLKLLLHFVYLLLFHSNKSWTTNLWVEWNKIKMFSCAIYSLRTNDRDCAWTHTHSLIQTKTALCSANIQTLVRKANICTLTHTRSPALCRSFAAFVHSQSDNIDIGEVSLSLLLSNWVFLSSLFRASTQCGWMEKVLYFACYSTLSSMSSNFESKFRRFIGMKRKKAFDVQMQYHFSILVSISCVFSSNLLRFQKRFFFIWFPHIAVGLRFLNRFIYLLLIFVSLLWFVCSLVCLVDGLDISHTYAAHRYNYATCICKVRTYSLGAFEVEAFDIFSV